MRHFEDRPYAVGLENSVVFTQRGDTFRVISLRKANNREISRYEQATEIDS
ncbi:BrnT family toxin [Mycetohabitans sp. B2]|nr:BrnT family toxin [Mycetohabitans sp. B2]